MERCVLFCSFVSNAGGAVVPLSSRGVGGATAAAAAAAAVQQSYIMCVGDGMRPR